MALSTPAIHASGNATAGSSKTTTSFSVAAGATVFVVAAVYNSNGSPSFNAPTSTHAGLSSWTPIDGASDSAGSDLCRIQAWYARNEGETSTTSGTVTLSVSGTGTHWAWVVFQVTGADPSAPVRQSVAAPASSTSVPLTLPQSPLSSSTCINSVIAINDTSISSSIGYTSLYTLNISSVHGFRSTYRKSAVATANWGGISGIAAGLLFEIQEPTAQSYDEAQSEAAAPDDATDAATALLGELAEAPPAADAAALLLDQAGLVADAADPTDAAGHAYAAAAALDEAAAASDAASPVHAAAAGLTEPTAADDTALAVVGLAGERGEATTTADGAAAGNALSASAAEAPAPAEAVAVSARMDVAADAAAAPADGASLLLASAAILAETAAAAGWASLDGAARPRRPPIITSIGL